MSELNTEKDLSYVSEMSENERRIFLEILVGLAHIDGVMDAGEQEFIADLAAALKVTVGKEIKPMSDDEIVACAKQITGRRTAMELVKEMCMLANSDGDLSDRETLLIGRVGLAMGLELEKVEQISQWVIDHIVWLEEGKIIFEKV